MTRAGKEEGKRACHSCGRPYELGYLMEWMPVGEPGEKE